MPSEPTLKPPHTVAETQGTLSTATSARPPFHAALMWAAVLSVTFVVFYGGCLHITALRPNVASWYFNWEMSIPVIPWLIIPYISIDLFFFASPFLAGTRDELNMLTNRLALAPMVAAIGFLLLPLELGYDPGSVEGFFAPVFRFLAESQTPHNLVPSLHVTYTLILRQTYHKHTQGWLNAGVHAWLALVTISTVLTHQHHLIDVAGGAVAGMLVLYFVPERGLQPLNWCRYDQRNERVALWYALGTIACGLLVVLLWPWGVLLTWPAIALAIVAGAYLGFGPAIFTKQGGRLSLPARLVLGPYLLGLWASRCYYARNRPAYQRIAPGILRGRQLSAREVISVIQREGITAVLDLTAEHSECRPFRNLNYKNIQILDLTQPTDEMIDRARTFIARHRTDGTVYVHCGLGRSRSVWVTRSFEGQATSDPELSVGG